MTASLITPATHVCVFALGCALIHIGRAHAATLTRLLSYAAAVAGAMVVIAAAAVFAPDDRERFDEITVYAAFTGIHNELNRPSSRTL